MKYLIAHKGAEKDKVCASHSRCTLDSSSALVATNPFSARGATNAQSAISALFNTRLLGSSVDIVDSPLWSVVEESRACHDKDKISAKNIKAAKEGDKKKTEQADGGDRPG